MGETQNERVREGNQEWMKKKKQDLRDNEITVRSLMLAW